MCVVASNPANGSRVVGAGGGYGLERKTGDTDSVNAVQLTPRYNGSIDGTMDARLWTTIVEAEYN